MKVKCSYEKCSGRRVSADFPDINRQHQEIEVPDDFAGKAYCSFECAAYDGVDLIHGNPRPAV